jgi:hypothetical protein
MIDGQADQPNPKCVLRVPAFCILSFYSAMQPELNVNDFLLSHGQNP